jgi:hypothetical protein
MLPPFGRPSEAFLSQWRSAHVRNSDTGHVACHHASIPWSCFDTPHSSEQCVSDVPPISSNVAVSMRRMSTAA